MLRLSRLPALALLLIAPALLGIDSCDRDVNAGYDPCASLACGESCRLCPPSDPGCVETAVLKFCQVDGACAATTPMCGPGDAGAATDAGPAYDPCAGATCGDGCMLCDPSDPTCVETAVLKFCQTDGTCAASTPMCGGAYDPCGGLSCGDMCTLCDPSDPTCVETAVVKFCQPDGSCVDTTPSCTP